MKAVTRENMGKKNENYATTGQPSLVMYTLPSHTKRTQRDLSVDVLIVVWNDLAMKIISLESKHSR
jgi:hypothetical protein